MSLFSRSPSTSALDEVEQLKKSLIQKHFQSPLIEKSLSVASEDHVVRVKDWVQDQEKELGLKVEVIAHLNQLSDAQLDSLMLSADESQTKAVTLKDRIILIASAIQTQKQAMDAYEQEVVGRYGVALLLKKHLDSTVLQIFQSMTEEKLLYLNEDLGFAFNLETSEGQKAAVLEHVARLASVVRIPISEQRRVSWYRGIARKFIPALQWTHDDVCALIRTARHKMA